MEMVSSTLKPWLGLGLLFVAVFPLADEVVNLAHGVVRPMVFMGCGVFLLLGILLVVEAFVPGWFLALLLFLLGTLFFAAMACVALSYIAPTFAMRPTIFIPLGAAGALGFFFHQTWKSRPRLEHDESRGLLIRTVIDSDRIKSASEAQEGAAVDTSAQSSRETGSHSTE